MMPRTFSLIAPKIVHLFLYYILSFNLDKHGTKMSRIFFLLEVGYNIEIEDKS